MTPDKDSLRTAFYGDRNVKKIPVLICIHVEPDEHQLDPNVPKDWEGFEKTFELFRQLRSRIREATQSPVHFSWFFRMDAQIAHAYGNPAWAVTRYRHLIEELESEGDELGLHTHAWRWDEAADHWFLDLGNQKWIEHCVRMSFEAFQESLRRPCHSFSFGNHWINNSTLELVQKLGARIDLTVEPGLKRYSNPNRFTGSFPDFTHVPRHPYQPSRADFTKRGIWRKRKLWLVPLSTGNIDWAQTSLARNGDETSSIRLTPKASPASAATGADVNHPNPAYEGFLDRVDSQMIAGWVYDANRPNDLLNVEVYDGGALLTTLPANSFRSDLLIAGKGNGRHSFGIPVPPWLNDGTRHSIRVKVAGSDFELSQSPKELNSHATHDSRMLLTLNTNPWFMRPSLDALLSRKNPYLALPIRSEVTLHLYELSNLEENFDYLLSHPLLESLVFETPPEMLKRLQ